MRATTGARLLNADAHTALRDELLPLVTIVTPNADEAGALLGLAAPRTVTEASEAAALLTKRGAAAALVTGLHHVDGDVSVDVLHDSGVVHEFRVPRIRTAHTHGTGCTLSSAIAALLARGYVLPEACAQAQRFVADSISRSPDLTVGRGSAPVHQLGDLWARATWSP